MDEKRFFVYILANQTNTTIYTGVTSDLPKRIYEHKHHLDPNSFTTKYNVTKLVYYEPVDSALSAIEREKQIKGWNRKRKNKLVSGMKPEWRELYDDVLG